MGLSSSLKALNPGRWITSLAAWWLHIPSDAAEKLRAQSQGDSNLANGEAPVANHIEPHSRALANHVSNNDRQLVTVHSASAAGQREDHPTSPLPESYIEGYMRDKQKWMDSIKDQIFSWQFSAFQLDVATNGHPLVTVTMTLLEAFDLLDGWKLDREKVQNFLLRVEHEYNPNSYHNNIHAADVTQTAAVILQSFAKQLTEIPKLEYFCIIISSAVHDLGHIGVNNDFLIKSKHPRATTYNDKSVNENFHICRAFEVARQFRECDIFDTFTVEEQRKARSLMIDMVLATDMAIHFDLLRNFNRELEAKPNMNDWTDRNLVYQMIVHLADIANPSRPFHLARGWAERVIAEFCDQGDKELNAGLPVSPFCNRSTMNMPRAQLNFIEIFLKPTLVSFEKAAPEFISMALEYLDKTIQEWQALEAAGFKMSAP